MTGQIDPWGQLLVADGPVAGIETRANPAAREGARHVGGIRERRQIEPRARGRSRPGRVVDRVYATRAEVAEIRVALDHGRREQTVFRAIEGQAPDGTDLTNRRERIGLRPGLLRPTRRRYPSGGGPALGRKGPGEIRRFPGERDQGIVGTGSTLAAVDRVIAGDEARRGERGCRLAVLARLHDGEIRAVPPLDELDRQRAPVRLRTAHRREVARRKSRELDSERARAGSGSARNRQRGSRTRDGARRRARRSRRRRTGASTPSAISA